MNPLICIVLVFCACSRSNEFVFVENHELTQVGLKNNNWLVTVPNTNLDLVESRGDSQSVRIEWKADHGIYSLDIKIAKNCSSAVSCRNWGTFELKAYEPSWNMKSWEENEWAYSEYMIDQFNGETLNLYHLMRYGYRDGYEIIAGCHATAPTQQMKDEMKSFVRSVSLSQTTQ